MRAVLQNLDKKTRLRWKLIIPLIVVISFGILATLVVTSYSLEKVVIDAISKVGVKDVPVEIKKEIRMFLLKVRLSYEIRD
ncbi:MAG: hypothetical protein QXY47_06275 [Thermoplasmata archaeon]